MSKMKWACINRLYIEDENHNATMASILVKESRNPEIQKPVKMKVGTFQ